MNHDPGTSAGVRPCTHCHCDRPTIHDVCGGLVVITCAVCGHRLATTGRVRELEAVAAEVVNRGRMVRDGRR